MTGWGRTLSLALLGVLVAPQAYGAGPRVPHQTLFTFQDADLFESSGLVDRGRTVFTVNDSGDDAVVYGVDAHTGRTVSRTTYADSVTDVEALAPGTDGTVWVGDTGDNRRNRDDVAVYRVRPVDGDHPGERFGLRYPDGPHDAETLLVQPRTQQVFVVSKSAFGGVVYTAPRDLRTGSRPNRLRVSARVPGLVTDGAFLPDGRHVVLRTYGTATVYTFPGFAPVGTVTLPAQPQGEGISVGREGRVLVSSEGVSAAVQRVTLPASLTDRPLRPTATSSTPSDVAAPRASPAPAPRRARDWVGIAVVAAAIAGVGYLTVRGSRLRGPRRTSR